MLVYPHGARRVGRYLLCDQVGSGGMATIHLARLLGAQGFSRTVAVKQLHPQFAQNPQFVAMLLDEARMAVRVRHGNVISPLDIVATGSELFIVMDYVNGETFANLLVAAAGPLRPSFAAAILVQVLLGLHAAHEATREQGEALGLVHRDVSPQNILVGQDGVSRVLDFGIAKAVTRKNTTEGGMVKGKLGYLAPEQVRLETVDRRTDLFSAGVVLWEALTGNGLFTADTLAASIDQVLHAKIAPPSQLNPDVTPELDAVVLKALERDPGARFPDAMSMAAALERAVPLASAMEIIDWVQKLAGPTLAHKADLVRRAEALNWEPVHTIGPTLAASAPGATAVATGWSEAVRSSSGHELLKRTLKGIAKPPQSHARESVPVATDESTGVAVGSDRDAAVTTEATGSRDWRSVGVALGIVAAASTIAIGGLLALSRGERVSSIGVARQPMRVEPALAVTVTAPPAEAPRLDRLDPPVPALPPSPPRLQAEPANREGPELRPSARLVAPHGMVKEAAVPRASKPESRPIRNAAGPRKTLVPRSPSDACKPPWIIDEHHIKVFKEECLR